MYMQKLSPNLMVKDVNNTVQYYKDLLGFDFIMGVLQERNEVISEMPAGTKLLYGLMKNGNIEIMFQAEKSLVEDLPALKDKVIGGSLTLYIEMEGVKEFYEKVKNKADVVKELYTTWYGMQEFYIKDINGYFLVFSENSVK